MKFKSSVYTQVSGSLGGITYSHNRGGLYARARSIPTNPSSTAQQLVRAAFTELVSAWSDELDASEISGWETYAANVPVTDAFGDPLTLTGQQMYIRCNTPRLYVGLPRVDSGPTEMTTGVPQQWTALSASATTNQVTFTIPALGAWADEDDSAMIIQVMRPQSGQRNFLGGPWRLAGIVEGDSVTPPSSFVATSPFLFSVGQQVPVRVRVSRADGRLSFPIRGLSAVAT